MSAPVSPSQPNQGPLRQHTPAEMLELANSLEEGHARVVHLDEWTQWASYKTDVVIAALRSHASLKARIEELQALVKAQGQEIQITRERDEELEAALRPFAAFADPRNAIPPDTILTAGSAMARKQITMADCYAARAALPPSTPAVSR